MFGALVVVVYVEGGGTLGLSDAYGGAGADGVGGDTYEAGLVEAISDFFMNYKKGEWQLGCAEWPNFEGGSCSVSWIEDGHLHMIGFDYRK